MDDLISRQAVIDAINSGMIKGDDSSFEGPNECNSMLEWAVNAVKELPTAEIVRCKDCKHSSYCYSEVHMLNKRRSTSICKDISFCSFAERKSNE